MMKSTLTLEPLSFDSGENIPSNVGYSNKTFKVRGKEVLVKREWDSMDDDEWYYLSLVDPETKERVFRDISEPQIKQLMKTGQYSLNEEEEVYPKTSSSVNKELRRLGIPVRVVSGGSYYYWLDLKGDIIEGTDCVLVYRANQLRMDRWVEEAQEAAKVLEKNLAGN